MLVKIDRLEAFHLAHKIKGNYHLKIWNVWVESYNGEHYADERLLTLIRLTPDSGTPTNGC